MKSFARLFAFSIAIAALFVLGSPVPAQPLTPMPSDERGLPTLAPVLKRVLPGVVNVAVQGRVAVDDNPLYQDPFFRRFFDLPDRPPEREFQSAGSGVVIDAGNGLVLTNNHVVAKADSIVVGLQDGRKLTAKLVGADPEADIALLKVSAANLAAVPLGSSEKLQVGDFVIAIGNPFGLGQTVTSGIVSALERSGLGIESYENFIQTDAAINPGNSGGALVNLRGELVGINTAIVGPAGGNVGIGFAIPIDMAREISAQLQSYGKVRRGRLGVTVQDAAADAAAAGKEGRQGALIVEVMPRSAAEKAGLKGGDVILAINGKPVQNAAQMRNRIGLVRVGQKVELNLLRNDRAMTVTAKLADVEP